MNVQDNIKNQCYLVLVVLFLLSGYEIRLLFSFDAIFWFLLNMLSFSFRLSFCVEGNEGGILMAFDDDLEGLKRKERDLNINLASPSKVAIELLLLFV